MPEKSNEPTLFNINMKAEEYSAPQGTSELSGSLRDAGLPAAPPPLPTQAIPPVISSWQNAQAGTPLRNDDDACVCCGSTQNVEDRAYLYAYSLILFSFLRTSEPRPICHRCRIRAGWRQNLISLCFGWFGLWGIVFTIRALWRNLHGGIVVQGVEGAVGAVVARGVKKAFEELRTATAPSQSRLRAGLLLTAAMLNVALASGCAENADKPDADQTRRSNQEVAEEIAPSFLNDGPSSRADSSLDRMMGVWVRKGDSFDGSIMMIQRSSAHELLGTMVYVSEEMGKYGWTAGDAKMKSIKEVAGAGFKCLSRVKGPKVDGWELMTGTFQDENELIFCEAKPSEREIGARQRWMRLKESDKHYGNYALGRAVLARRAGNWRQASEYFALAVRHDDRDPEFLNDYAWLLATCKDASERKPQKAIELAIKACELTSFGNGPCLDTLAAAYAAAANFAKAVEIQELACKTFADPPAEYTKHPALYRRGKPFVEM